MDFNLQNCQPTSNKPLTWVTHVNSPTTSTVYIYIFCGTSMCLSKRMVRLRLPHGGNSIEMQNQSFHSEFTSKKNKKNETNTSTRLGGLLIPKKTWSRGMDSLQCISAVSFQSREAWWPHRNMGWYCWPVASDSFLRQMGLVHCFSGGSHTQTRFPKVQGHSLFVCFFVANIFKTKTNWLQNKTYVFQGIQAAAKRARHSWQKSDPKTESRKEQKLYRGKSVIRLHRPGTCGSPMGEQDFVPTQNQHKKELVKHEYEQQLRNHVCFCITNARMQQTYQRHHCRQKIHVIDPCIYPCSICPEYGNGSKPYSALVNIKFTPLKHVKTVSCSFHPKQGTSGFDPHRPCKPTRNNRFITASRRHGVPRGPSGGAKHSPLSLGRKRATMRPTTSTILEIYYSHIGVVADKQINARVPGFQTEWKGIDG